MAMTKVKNLQLWCKKMADGYRDVEVKDMSSSWKSGLAFCAIIHRFRPDLIDYDSLSKENVFENNQLAFEVAEKQLNIPAFLEAADMVAIRVPDRLSVVTYVSQYYNYFHDKPQLGGPGVNKCSSSSKKKEPGVTETKSLTTSQNIKDNQQIKNNRQESIGDKCTICHDKVYLLERHIESGNLYHRSCFRKSELSPTTKVFKRQPNNNIEEDKDTSSATKLRKIDDKKDVDLQSDPKPDFWQRRAEAKAKKEGTGNKGNEVLSKFDDKNKAHNSAEIPSWEQNLDLKNNPSTFQQGVGKLDKDKKTDEIASQPSNNSNNSSALGKKQTNAGDLVSKFKELDERNLKAKEGAIKLNEDRTKDNSKSLALETNKTDSPKPKPRHNFMASHEKMDVSEPSVKSQPKAKPRGLKSKDDDQPPKPDHLKPTLRTKTTDRPKSDFTRPKTPPRVGKSDFNLTSTTSNRSELKSASSPPPLPSSTPPNLLGNDSNNSSNSSPKFGKKVASPRSSPRYKDKNTNSVGGARDMNTNVPSKPDRTSSPMDTSEKNIAYKAVVHEPSGFKAVVSTPKGSSDDNQNKEVLGGLLKSLANVRTKHDKDLEKSADISTNKAELKQRLGADKIETNASRSETSKIKVPPRPKSSFVSQNSHLFGDKEPSKDPKVKGVVTTKKTTVTTTVITKQTDGGPKQHKNTINTTTSDIIKDEIPEWKKQLEKHKQEKARPKSADLLSDKSFGKNDTSGMLEWQKEAAARKEARQGGYVDPEKHGSPAANNPQSNKPNRPPSPYQRKAVDAIDKYVPSTDKDNNNLKSPECHKPNGDSSNSVGKTVDKKKIGLGQKFVFEDPTDVTPPPSKPPRMPDVSTHKLESPTSPKPSAPRRPPPPKSDGTVSRTKHHITPYKIQQELKLIDSKLTQLELKGRTLEDSLRKASEHDQDEDDLMISWFQLVNEKNELVRTENDYIYISRQQELEIEQEDIDRKLRVLLNKPEKAKTEDDRKEEEYLTEKLLHVVDKRNRIVDSIDEDRLRYLEEDRDIEKMLQNKAFKEEPPVKPKKVKKKKLRGLGFLKDNKEGKAKKEKTNPMT